MTDRRSLSAGAAPLVGVRVRMRALAWAGAWALVWCHGVTAHAAGEQAHARDALTVPGHAAGGQASFVFDAAHHHNHWYPATGSVMPTLPDGSVALSLGRERFFFHSGVWLHPVGAQYLVVLPPVGVWLPLLPGDAAALMLAGSIYYYANGVYYAPAPSQGYVVVAPPADIESATAVQGPPAVAPASLAGQLVFYPRNGQSPQQTESDRQDCNRWATTQSDAMAHADVFQRAVAACMDAHGYTVR